MRSRSWFKGRLPAAISDFLTEHHAITTTQISIRAQAQILAVGIAVTCLFYRVASTLNPSIISMIPPPFQACAFDTCARLLELCLENPWQPRALKDRSTGVRYWVSFALGQLRTKKALPELRRLVNADNALLPGWGRVSDSAAEAIDSIEAAR